MAKYNSKKKTTRNERARNNKKRRSQPAWTSISGLMHVFGNERKTKKGKPFLSYSTTVGRKNEDGDWENMYYNVGFRKDDDPEIVDGFDIIVKDGFLSFDEYTTKDGEVVKTPRVVVLKYEMVDTMQERYNDEDEDEEDEDEEDD